MLAAGFRLTAGDVGAVNGILVRYRVGGDTKTQYFPFAAIICVKPNPCGGKNADDAEAFKQRTLVDLGLVEKDAYS